MPFVIICGLPSSGKSERAKQLKEYFEKQSKVVNIISDNSFLNKDKNVCYSNSSNEKELRGTLKSEVQKLISKESVLILDALNYIKGYRYELYCVSKLCQTPQCTIFTDTDFDTCKEWNKSRDASEAYSEDILNALEMRFEGPDAKSRWDAPLFTVHKDDELPFNEIQTQLFNTKAPPPNKSTLNKPLSETSFLHDIDKITHDITTYLIDLQKNQLAGDEITIPNATEKIKFVRPVSIHELRKWRQQFLTYIKMHPPNDSSKISNMFVQYLNNMFI